MLNLRSAAIEATFDGDVTQTGTLGLKSHSNAHVVPHLLIECTARGRALRVKSAARGGHRT
jgi:hypothetical protein